MNENAKIREAEFFLNHIRSADYPKATRYYTSAFLSAARSVLLYAREEAQSKGAVGQQWYDTEVRLDPLTGFLTDHRAIIASSNLDVPGQPRKEKKPRVQVQGLERSRRCADALQPLHVRNQTDRCRRAQE